MNNGGDLLDRAMPVTRWRDHLQIHPAATKMRPMSAEEFESLCVDIKAHGLQVPVTLLAGETPQLLDGRHRLDALEAIGRTVVDAEGSLQINHEMIEARPGFNPYSFVRSVNLERRHENRAQKRKAIERLLVEEPGRTDRSIAKEAGVHQSTVTRIRSKHGSNDAMHNKPARVEATGRQARGRKPGGGTTPRKRRADSETPHPEPVEASAPLAPVAEPAEAPRVDEPLDITHPIEGYADDLRSLMLKAMARDVRFDQWPRLARRLREEIGDVEQSFPRLQREMEELGKCA